MVASLAASKERFSDVLIVDDRKPYAAPPASMRPSTHSATQVDIGEPRELMFVCHMKGYPGCPSGDPYVDVQEASAGHAH